MKRFLSGLLFAGVITAVAIACDSSSSSFGGYGYSGAPSYGQAPCSDYGACETCTPQLGCGWCYLPNGTGRCLPDPAGCPLSQDTWTWDASGCRTAATPTVGPEAEGGTSSPEASTSDAATDGAAGDGTAPAADGATGNDGSSAKDSAAPVADSGSSEGTPDAGTGVIAADSGPVDGGAAADANAGD